MRGAIERAERGLVDADLGGVLIEARVARSGEGRSGGYRMLVAYRWADRAVFLYGFAKNERDNIEPDELATLRRAGSPRALPGLRVPWRAGFRWRYRTMDEGQPIRLARAILETADDMLGAGIMNKVTHRKIALRHLGGRDVGTGAPMTAGEIRRLREDAHVSQAVFARDLNLTTGYVSQLERGAKRPVSALLNTVRRKGIEGIL